MAKPRLTDKEPESHDTKKQKNKKKEQKRK